MFPILNFLTQTFWKTFLTLCDLFIGRGLHTHFRLQYSRYFNFMTFFVSLILMNCASFFFKLHNKSIRISPIFYVIHEYDNWNIISSSSSLLFQVDSSGTGRFLPHGVLLRGGVRPGEEVLRLVPVQSAGPAGEEDGRESGEILQLLRQHVQGGLQAACQEGRR